VGPQYLIPLLWSGIDPVKFPSTSASKIHRHDQSRVGRQYRIGAPIDRAFVVKTLQDRLTQNYYRAMREFHYYDIEPRVMIEEFLDDGHPTGRSIIASGASMGNQRQS